MPWFRGPACLKYSRVYSLAYPEVVDRELFSTVRVGGKAVLTVPSELAYGADGIGQIPGDSALQFEVELLEVTEGEAEKKMFGFM